MAWLCRSYMSFWMTIIICFYILHHACSSHVSTNQCDSSCQLSILDEYQTYRQFNDIIKSPSIRVVFFYLYKGYSNESFHQLSGEFGIFYAWLRQHSGQAIFTLPSDYITTTLSLYMVFASSFRINVSESTPDCYNDTVGDTCRSLIIFKAIGKWMEVNRHKNSSIRPGTLCRRKFALNNIDALSNINYSCCEEKESNSSKIDLNKCTDPKNVGWYVPIMRIFTIVLSFSLGGMLWSKVINMYLETLER